MAGHSEEFVYACVYRLGSYIMVCVCVYTDIFTYIDIYIFMFIFLCIKVISKTKESFILNRHIGTLLTALIFLNIIYCLTENKEGLQ